MKKMIFLTLISLTLSGCSIFSPHKLDIRQGNIISSDAVSRLHRGMSEGQVKQIMGNPVLVNIFSTSRIDYVYTNQPGSGDLSIKRVICTFQNGTLANIQLTQSTVKESSGFFGLGIG